MKVHMVKITRGIWGSDSTKTGSLCGRLNNASRDGMNVTDKPSEVTCAFCRRFNLKEAAKRIHRTDEDVPVEDPTPWCSGCGAMTRAKCKCGPIADNE